MSYETMNVDNDENQVLDANLIHKVEDVADNTAPDALTEQPRAQSQPPGSPHPHLAESLPPSDPLEPRYRLKATLSGHTRAVSSLKFSPDGSLLASSGVLASPVFCCRP